MNANPSTSDMGNVPRSTLLIPVPEAAPAVAGFRQVHDPSAARGMPEHVTLLYPFLPPPQLNEDISRTLRTLVAGTASFTFTLPRLGRFGDRVLYLAPDPPHPFITLSERCMEAFGVLPYGGKHAGITPHLTIAQGADEGTMRAITGSVEHSLPLTAIAREVWLMVREPPGDWRLYYRFSLAGG